MLEQLQRCSDLQPAKLAVLQRILQSDFCDMVREVYEHVYETVEVEGSTEVRASATAKATVAAFAASEGHAHPRVVELPKTEEGLGFNVMGGKEQNSPIYISRIIPGKCNNSIIFFLVVLTLYCYTVKSLLNGHPNAREMWPLWKRIVGGGKVSPKAR